MVHLENSKIYNLGRFNEGMTPTDPTLAWETDEEWRESMHIPDKADIFLAFATVPGYK